jgi:dipeptidyl aminopeptidase/acylaminoacyl peptidase
MQNFVAVNSKPDRPYRTDLYRCNGEHLGVVQKADLAKVESLGYVPSEEFTVTAADGKTTLWGVMHKPFDFDPTKNYPVIDHIYGGPQATLVSHTFGIGADAQSRIDHALLDRALAQLGYIVLSVDARGTPERSKAFQDTVYERWGQHEIEDHVATIKQLAQRHAFLDLHRVGIWGYSWGGYFAIRGLAQAPGTFHVGVAAAPTTDPLNLFIYEPYLNLPSRTRSAYDYANNCRLAEKIEGKLLIVAGTADPVMYSDALRMTHYLIEAGVDHELVVLPEANHYFQGRDQDYFIRKLVKHFEVHLKPRKVG